MDRLSAIDLRDNQLLTGCRRRDWIAIKKEFLEIKTFT